MMQKLTLHSSWFALRSCSLVQPRSSRLPSLSQARSNLPPPPFTQSLIDDIYLYYVIRGLQMHVGLATLSGGLTDKQTDRQPQTTF